MAGEHAEAFEYDTLVERSVALAHQLAARRAPSGHELAGQGDHAHLLLTAEIADTLSQGLASVTLAILATGRAIARAADGEPQHAAADLAGTLGMIASASPDLDS